MKKMISVVLMSVFYIMAGINHFRHPELYIDIIPPAFPAKEFLNTASGILEILLAVLLLIPATRKWASFGFIGLLILFIPVHIYMIKTGWSVNGTILPQWAIWFRLLVAQPLLILWAWWNGKINDTKKEHR